MDYRQAVSRSSYLIHIHAIAYTDDERLLVDGRPVALGRYRLQLGDEGGKLPVLTVAGDEETITVISAADVLNR